MIHLSDIQRAGQDCPACGAKGVLDIDPADLSQAGKVKQFQCPCCGVRGEATLARREVFEWSFDGFAHTVLWDICAMRAAIYEDDPQRERARIVPLELLESYLALNPQAVEDGASSRFDVEEPLILIEHPTAFLAQGMCPWLLVDGWHRAEQAVKRCVPLRGWYVTRAFEEQFRLIDIIHLGCKTHPIKFPQVAPTTVFESCLL